MRAVIEYLPVGLGEVLSPPPAMRMFPECVLAETPHETHTFYPSARAALRAAILDAGVSGDDEVLIPGYTCYAVRAVVADVAVPVYVDVTDAFTMDLEAATEAITDDTAAVVPIHQYGLESDMAAVRTLANEHDLTIIEDAAQAVSNLVRSEQVGTGDYTVLSVRYFKETTAFAGGLLLGADHDVPPDVSRRFLRLKLTGVWGAHHTLRRLPGAVYQSLREHILDPLARDLSASLDGTVPVPLDEWSRRLLASQFEEIDARTERRRDNAAIYRDVLPDAFTLPPAVDNNTYVRFPVRVPRARGRLLRRLRRAGIGASPMWEYTIAPAGSCPTSHCIADEILVLPVHAGLDAPTVRLLGETVTDIWNADC